MESFIRFLEVISFDRVGVSGNLKFSTDETGCYSLFCREYIKQIGYGGDYRMYDFEEFKNVMEQMVKEKFSEGYQVERHKVIKNNQLELDSLVNWQRILMYHHSFICSSSIQDMNRERRWNS